MPTLHSSRTTHIGVVVQSDVDFVHGFKLIHKDPKSRPKNIIRAYCPDGIYRSFTASSAMNRSLGIQSGRVRKNYKDVTGKIQFNPRTMRIEFRPNPEGKNADLFRMT